ncbi:hypothetical protein [Desulfofalx alkaliphila]|uniref:hypothetical protein n=1 Tax=Desulfofalx alkaliphila TaxID=105483 RepID=UPI0004E1EC73|nr:hypothetical protein [Desulfofalx alkaliphila]
MSRDLSLLLAKKFNLNEEQGQILVTPIRNLNRRQRKILFEELRPKQRDMRIYLEEQYYLQGEEQRQRWVDETVTSIFNNGGEPNTVDALMMEIVGRIEILHRVKKRSIKTQQPLKAMSGSGSFTFFITIVAVLTAVVLLIMNI